MTPIEFKSLLFVDFDDSFSANILCELYAYDIHYQKVHWKQFLKSENELKNDVLIMLGPGPGHPLDYSPCLELIQRLLDKKFFFYGICLGHQLLWAALGGKIKRSKNPLHGQCVDIDLPTWLPWLDSANFSLQVQRYNSLVIDENSRPRESREELIKDNQGEVLMWKFGQGIAMQFHPESIGTSFPQAFFAPLKKLFYNHICERSDHQSQRYLRSKNPGPFGQERIIHSF